jgi:hypothetical protein
MLDNLQNKDVINRALENMTKLMQIFMFNK